MIGPLSYTFRALSRLQLVDVPPQPPSASLLRPQNNSQSQNKKPSVQETYTQHMHEWQFKQLYWIVPHTECPHTLSSPRKRKHRASQYDGTSRRSLWPLLLSAPLHLTAHTLPFPAPTLLTLAVRCPAVAGHAIPRVLLHLKAVVKGELLSGADVGPREEDDVALAVKLDILGCSGGGGDWSVRIRYIPRTRYTGYTRYSCLLYKCSGRVKGSPLIPVEARAYEATPTSVYRYTPHHLAFSHSYTFQPSLHGCPYLSVQRRRAAVVAEPADGARRRGVEDKVVI